MLYFSMSLLPKWVLSTLKKDNYLKISQFSILILSLSTTYLSKCSFKPFIVYLKELSYSLDEIDIYNAEDLS